MCVLMKLAYVLFRCYQKSTKLSVGNSLQVFFFLPSGWFLFHVWCLTGGIYMDKQHFTEASLKGCTAISERAARTGQFPGSWELHKHLKVTSALKSLTANLAWWCALKLFCLLIWKILAQLKAVLLNTVGSWGAIFQCPGASSSLLVAAAEDRVLLSVKKIGCWDHNSSATLVASWTPNASACKVEDAWGEISEM